MHLPRETRAYATLWGTAPDGKPVPLAWTSWPLFDQHGVFRTGTFSASMWHGGGTFLDRSIVCLRRSGRPIRSRFTASWRAYAYAYGAHG